jgi:7-cyano-7-deazaguanine synthase
MLYLAPSGELPVSKSAIVLLSGGLDSATCLGIASDLGYSPIALSFDYGQRHEVELRAARALAEHYAVKEHLVLQVPAFRVAGGSALTADIEVPKHLSADDLKPGIPATYVPARNLVFLALATALAEAHGIRDLFIGVNAVDYSGYPDCRPEFIEAFQRAATLGTKAADGSLGSDISVHTPLAGLSKAEIITRGSQFAVPYHLTHSCYDPDGGLACGHCDSCLLRLRGFQEAGLEDPVNYAPQGQVS